MRHFFLALMLLLPVTFMTAAVATGPQPKTPVATGTAATGDQTVRAYGAGSTGLTSTAECLGSHGIVFNLISTTYVEKGCVVRHYAKQCKDDKCRKAMTCLDPDLIEEAKAVLGCPSK